MLAHIAAFICAVSVALAGCVPGGGCGQRVKNIVTSSEQSDYPGSLRNDLLQLREAALVFAERDRPQECANLADEIDDLLDDFEQRQEARRERAARLQYLQAATPVTRLRAVLKAQEMGGRPVHNLADQELGVIENMALNPYNGRIAYVVLATGGFIGLGEKLVPLQWRDLSVTDQGELFVVDLKQKALEKMKGLTPSSSLRGQGMLLKLDEAAEPRRAMNRRAS
jgi:hypothetical protein